MSTTDNNLGWESWYWGKEWAQMIAKAWADPTFKQRLLTDPLGILREEGLSVPAGVQVKVRENTDEVINLTLPARPDVEELAEQDLLSVVGAGGAQRTIMDTVVGRNIQNQVNNAGRR